MKLSISKSILENILIHAQPFLEKKDTSHITSHIFLNLSNSILTLKATDNEIGFQVSTNQIIPFEDGSVTANGKKFLDIVKILKDDEINLQVKNNLLFVSQKNSNFKLPIFEHSKFPSFPIIENEKPIVIDSNILIESLKKITPAIDNNNPKYELNGALMDIKQNKISFASTDTRRLALVHIQNHGNEELCIIIPKKAIIEIQKLFFDKINIYYDNTNLVITSHQYQFFTKLINGKYPNYEKIIPKEIKHTLLLPKKSMIEAIKQITIISGDFKLTFINDSIIFEALSDDNIEAKTKIDFVTGFDEPFSMAINSRYLLDFLNNINSLEFSIGLNKGNLPFILSDKNFKTVIMPIVI